LDADYGQWIERIISDFVHNSPENSLKMETDEKAFDEVLVGFSAGSDPLYTLYKEVVGEQHWTPLETFSMKFPDLPANAEDLTVISWVLPQREATKSDNRKESFYPSRRWVQARFPGEEFNNCLRRHVVKELSHKGIRSVAPLLLPEWTWGKSQKFVFSSNWSERHAAYAAGLGTFGLCDGLITSKGKAHRVGSVVANLRIQATTRHYDDRHAYCLFNYDGSCSGCRKRCPVGAITEEGHDKVKCWDHAGVTCAQFVKENYGFAGYGCGLCQTGVPCESGIPKKILKSLESSASQRKQKQR
jgi:epoxyqueuosine reductase